MINWEKELASESQRRKKKISPSKVKHLVLAAKWEMHTRKQSIYYYNENKSEHTSKTVIDKIS